MSATRRAAPLRHPALIEHEVSRGASAQNRVADKITEFAGSMAFVYLHVLWFAAWIIFRVEARRRVPATTTTPKKAAVRLTSIRPPPWSTMGS